MTRSYKKLDSPNSVSLRLMHCERVAYQFNIEIARDRMIMAQSELEKIPVITYDPAFKTGLLEVIPE